MACIEIGKLALLNDLRIYELANAIIEETLKDKEKIKAPIEMLKNVNEFNYRYAPILLYSVLFQK